MSELVQKLAKGDHPVIITAGRDNTLAEFKAALDRNSSSIQIQGRSRGRPAILVPQWESDRERAPSTRAYAPTRERP